MTGVFAKPGRVALIVEIALFALVAYSVAYTLNFLFATGRLPQPYFFGASDTTMDWINVAYWANNPGAYYEYLSVYPPLAFDFLNIFSIHSCYRFDNYFARDCDWLSRYALLATYFSAVGVSFLAFRKHDRRTALVRTGAMGLGLPMLYALERGNLVIISYVFFVLGHAKVLKSARLRWLSLALSMNFKPYLLVSVLPRAIRGEWRWLEGATLMAVTVYILSYATFGVGAPAELVRNTFMFNELKVFQLIDWAYYATTYQMIIGILKSNFPLMVFTGSPFIEGLQTVLPMLIHLGQAGVVLCFVAAFFRPHCTPMHRLTALAVAVVMTTTNVGGYSQIYLYFLVLLEPWRGACRITALVLVYLLSISADYPLMPLAYAEELSWLSNRYVGFNLYVQLGELTRPALILVIQYALIIATLGDYRRANALPRASREDAGHAPALGRPAPLPA